MVTCVAVACGGQVSGEKSGGSGGYVSHTGGSGGIQVGGKGGASGGFGAAGSSGIGATGGVGDGGYGNFAGAPPENILGDECESDGSCEYMNCLDSLHPGGGAPHGMCSFDCAADATICSVVPGSSCQKLGGSAYCVASCTQGPDGTAVFDPTKCGGREDMACAPLFDGTFGCLPNCNGDFDCPNGTVCNPKNGLCQVGAVAGADTGTPCGDGTACKGECLADTGICGDRCTVGALPSCGWSGPGAGPAPAICANLPGPKLAFGDLAHCTKLCDCDDDCAPSLGCAPFVDPNVVGSTGRAGYCAPGGPQTPCN
jgi:hypothetical protein